MAVITKRKYGKTPNGGVRSEMILDEETGQCEILEYDLMDKVIQRTYGSTKPVENSFCPTGPGGGVDAHCSPEGGPELSEKALTGPVLSEKAQRAKDSHHLVDAKIQQYAEEHNERAFAKGMGGVSFPNSEPADVVIPGPDGALAHGIELKTMVDNKNNKITMKRSAMERKAEWERKNKCDVHTVVIDDSKVFNAKGEGKHDESKRVYYYKRGYGSFRVGSMHKCSGLDEVKELLGKKDKELPDSAKRPPGQKRGRLAPKGEEGS